MSTGFIVLVSLNMFTLILFSFISGLVSILAPCIWPLLPIVLSSSASGGKKKPLGIVLGIVTSFTLITLSISYIIKIFHFDAEILRFFAVFVIGILGLSLIIPSFGAKLEFLVSIISSKFSSVKKFSKEGFGTGFLVGLSLGIIWTPCAGPILATVATLASTRAVNIQIIFVTLSFMFGVSIPLFVLSILGARIFEKSKFLNKYTSLIQRIFGVVMIITSVIILFNFDKAIQAKLLDKFPSYTYFLVRLESGKSVTSELDKIKSSGGNKNIDKSKVNMIFAENVKSSTLPKLGIAPEFTGIYKWLNTDQDLTMEKLKGKVVLIDFWTYTCINCIRTLPHVVDWYEKYKDNGFVVVGVHTPEFEFEKKTKNVQNAISQYKIGYPVSQDNDYGTWSAYGNRYWPAHYLVDVNGVVRFVHFGEGSYDETESAIVSLLNEGGFSVSKKSTAVKDESLSSNQTPETYLGSTRAERQESSSQNLPLNHFSLGGKWNVSGEEATPTLGSNLSFNFIANKVFLVITSTSPGAKIKVFLDGKVIESGVSGKDVQDGYIKVDVSRLYELVDLKGNRGTHILRLEFENSGVSLFAFTFG